MHSIETVHYIKVCSERRRRMQQRIREGFVTVFALIGMSAAVFFGGQTNHKEATAKTWEQTSLPVQHVIAITRGVEALYAMGYADVAGKLDATLSTLIRENAPQEEYDVLLVEVGDLMATSEFEKHKELIGPVSARMLKNVPKLEPHEQVTLLDFSIE
jgi:hypothetical protein